MNYIDPQTIEQTCTEDNKINNSRDDSPEREYVRKLMYLSLTEKEYRIYFLRYFMGMSRRDLGELFDTKPTSVYRSLDRVNMKVKKITDKVAKQEEVEDSLRDIYFDYLKTK